ncbi:MAG: 30S ribosomal protein S4e [Candidatus Helarchaeales archaeon]
MGSKGGSKHLKRYSAPKFWKLHTKEKTWALKPMPGPHPLKDSIPLLILIRDVLNLVSTNREAKYVLANNEILVDNVIRKKPKFPVGFMDTVEIPKTGKTYRLLYKYRRGLIPVEIPSEEKNVKLCKIIGKTILKQGKLQINLHDGRNIMVDDDTERKNDLKNVKIRDVLKITLPEQEVLEIIKFQEESFVTVTAGKHQGQYGTLKNIIKRLGTQANTVVIESEGESFETKLDYVFVVGQPDPVITLEQ